MRLIDVDEFRRFAHEQLEGEKTYSIDEILEMIDEQPTAYDIDKVVAELKKQKICIEKSCEAISQEDCNKYTDCGLCIVDRAIDIVKRGGVK